MFSSASCDTLQLIKKRTPEMTEISENSIRKVSDLLITIIYG